MTKNTADKQKLKKYVVFALMGVAFAGCIWLIFSPSQAEKEKQAQGTGYNGMIPDPAPGEIIADKRGAYEQESMKQRQTGNMVSLEEFSSLLEQNGNAAPATGENPGDAREGMPPAIAGSAASYREINRTLENFYENPREDEREQEILALEWRLQEMEKKLEEKESRQAAIDEQVALMEKSYELAAKYMPQAQGTGNSYPQADGPSGLSAAEVKGRIGKAADGKAKVSPLERVHERTVSALQQQYSGDELTGLYDRPRNSGFNTLGNEQDAPDKNTVRACVHEHQTVMSGQSVFIRLLEDILVEGNVIPAGTILTAAAALQGERLVLEIATIEYAGAIYHVKVSVYDTDGTKGVYVPASMELDALKEVAANMGNAVGTSFTMTQSAGAQVASDLTKGLIQGGSQYFAKKVKMVKVNLKAGHKLLLYPEKQ